MSSLPVLAFDVTSKSFFASVSSFSNDIIESPAEMAVVKVSDVFGFLSNCHANNFTCDDPIPPCSNPKGLDFAILWNITENYVKHCTTNGSWLYDPGVDKPMSSVALNNAACEIIAGKGKTDFPMGVVWARLTTWKFPLIQLVATSPRPPLGFMVETFTVLHLLGDPIGSISDIMCKIESCQSRAVFWQANISTNNILPRTHADLTPKAEQDKLWKALTIITDSYDEWGCKEGNKALKGLLKGLQNQDSHLILNNQGSHAGDTQNLQPTFSDICLTTGGALAADRATRFLPVIVAEVLFILVFGIAIYRIQSDGEQEFPTILMNTEIHSIGFSAVYFWLISAVVMTSVVGTSQTAEAIPRILERFRKDLSNAKIALNLPELKLGDPDSNARRLHGGIYTWQPSQKERFTTAQNNAHKELKNIQKRAGRRKDPRKRLMGVWPGIYWVLPAIIVVLAISTGLLISMFVPPIGPSCRTWGQLYFGFGWLASYIATLLVPRFFPEEWWFCVMVFKDFVATVLSVGWIVLTQLGHYNKCKCYTRWGHAGLALPEQMDTKNILLRGLKGGGSYTWILTVGILAQVLVVPVLLLWRYRAASRVYWQKDDGTSNLQFFRGRNENVVKSDGTLASFPKVARPATIIIPNNREAGEVLEQVEHAEPPPNKPHATASGAEPPTRPGPPSETVIELSERPTRSSNISLPDPVRKPTRRTTFPREQSEDRTPLLAQSSEQNIA